MNPDKHIKYVRTVKKIRCVHKKKSTRNNVRVRIKQQINTYGDY